MSDKIRAFIGILFTGGMLVMPLLVGLWAWQAYDVQRGILLALLTFIGFFVLAAVTFRGIKDPSVFLAMVPFFMSMFYGVFPDLPMPIDDTVVQIGGSLLSYMMLRRSNPNLPGWTLPALLATSLYSLFGIVIPGPIDELLVQLLAAYGVTRANKTPRLAEPVVRPPEQQPGIRRR